MMRHIKPDLPGLIFLVDQVILNLTTFDTFGEHLANQNTILKAYLSRHGEQSGRCGYFKGFSFFCNLIHIFHLTKKLLRSVEVSYNDRPKQSVDARHFLPGISSSDIVTEISLQSKVM